MVGRTNFAPVRVPMIPEDYPTWRIIETSRKFQGKVNKELDKEEGLPALPREMVVAAIQV